MGTRNFCRWQSLKILTNTTYFSPGSPWTLLEFLGSSSREQQSQMVLPFPTTNGRVSLPFSTTTSLPRLSVRLEYNAILFFKCQNIAHLLYSVVKRSGWWLKSFFFNFTFVGLFLCLKQNQPNWKLLIHKYVDSYQHSGTIYSLCANDVSNPNYMCYFFNSSKSCAPTEHI